MLLLIYKHKTNNNRDSVDKQEEEGGPRTLLTFIVSPQSIAFAAVALLQSIALALLESITDTVAMASLDSIAREQGGRQFHGAQGRQDWRAT
jgi:hypothetical protein